VSRLKQVNREAKHLHGLCDPKSVYVQRHPEVKRAARAAGLPLLSFVAELLDDVPLSEYYACVRAACKNWLRLVELYKEWLAGQNDENVPAPDARISPELLEVGAHNMVMPGTLRIAAATANALIVQYAEDEAAEEAAEDQAKAMAEQAEESFHAESADTRSSGSSRHTESRTKEAAEEMEEDASSLLQLDALLLGTNDDAEELPEAPKAAPEAAPEAVEEVVAAVAQAPLLLLLPPLQPAAHAAEQSQAESGLAHLLHRAAPSSVEGGEEVEFDGGASFAFPTALPVVQQQQQQQQELQELPAAAAGDDAAYEADGGAAREAELLAARERARALPGAGDADGDEAAEANLAAATAMKAMAEAAFQLACQLVNNANENRKRRREAEERYDSFRARHG
jgi:hypothetical protein